jgi:Zn-dependent oligopeptidase
MFAVYDTRKGKEGNLVGHFYLDLFPRPGKYGHAACFTLQQSCTNSKGERQVNKNTIENMLIFTVFLNLSSVAPCSRDGCQFQCTFKNQAITSKS